MATQQRLRGIRVLKAVSSSVRLHILNLLFDKGPLSYTELMNLLKMSPSRDAGRFAYHLKFLLKADLVEADVESKKYSLTELGKMVIDIAEEIEKKSFKTQKVLVRTSRYKLEEFDANKIAESLIREAGMPTELAQKIAKETEKRLLRAKTKYLTAPLIREVVNAMLIEKGLEDYRHKLTRLGLPVHDVSSLLAKSKTSQGASFIYEEAGKNVFEQYTLLNVLPRDVADAHLSGALHLHGLSCWTLKPSEIVHDLRFFFKKGLKLEQVNILQVSYPPPKSLEAALTLVFNVLLCSARETCEAQTLEYFNVFLAPFMRGVEIARAKEVLRLFIFNINHRVNVSLNLELTVPEFLAEKLAVGASGEPLGIYRDFAEESQLLASLLLEVLAEESARKPLLNPKFIIKMRPETFGNDKAATILLEAHRLASEKGRIYFANLSEKNAEHSVFSSSGCKLKTDPKGDWEIDTLRTGILGYVTLNLPRIVYECEKEKKKFFEILRDRLEMSTRVLEIKYSVLKARGKGLLPFLTHAVDGDQYLRLESSARLINLAGLMEAAEVFSGKNIYQDENAFRFALDAAKEISDFVFKAGKREKRLLLSILPFIEASERLARIDVERYGVSKVRFFGTREKPYYSTFSRINIQEGEKLSKTLAVEKEMRKLFNGGSLTVVELGDAEYDPNELLSLTRKLAENYEVEFFTYNRNLTYCLNCQRSWFGLLRKCPSCGAASTLTAFKGFP
ncbi:MAG: anaerobic ribonucleoside-triphosphate reductase [Candidatus Bathyarchaeia archaeon]